MPIKPSESAKVARLEQRVSLDSSSPLFLPLAEAYRQDGRAPDAERVLRAGLAHYEQHFSGRTALGRVLLQLGRPEEALRQLERVCRAVPDNLLAARLLLDARRQAVQPLEAPAPARPILEDPPVDVSLAVPDPAVQRRVAALRRFLAGARSLRGQHA